MSYAPGVGHHEVKQTIYAAQGRDLSSIGTQTMIEEAGDEAMNDDCLDADELDDTLKVENNDKLKGANNDKLKDVNQEKLKDEKIDTLKNETVPNGNIDKRKGENNDELKDKNNEKHSGAALTTCAVCGFPCVAPDSL